MLQNGFRQDHLCSFHALPTVARIVAGYCDKFLNTTTRCVNFLAPKLTRGAHQFYTGVYAFEIQGKPRDLHHPDEQIARFRDICG
jgi:hypothetical protein